MKWIKYLVWIFLFTFLFAISLPDDVDAGRRGRGRGTNRGAKRGEGRGESGDVAAGASCSGAYGSQVEGADGKTGAAYQYILTRITIDCDSPASYTLNVWGRNNYENTYRLLIYDDDVGGEPGTLLEDGGLQATANNETDAWFSDTFTVSLSAGNYWVGVQICHSGNLIYASADSGGVTREIHNDTDCNAEDPFDNGNDSHETWVMGFYLSF